MSDMAGGKITLIALGAVLALASPCRVQAQTAGQTKPATAIAAPVPAAKVAPQAAPAEAAAAKPAAGSKGAAVFPSVVNAKYASQKPGKARMHTCLDQYHANKDDGGNGGLNWVQKGGGYFSQCSKKLKAGSHAAA